MASSPTLTHPTAPCGSGVPPRLLGPQHLRDLSRPPAACGSGFQPRPLCAKIASALSRPSAPKVRRAKRSSVLCRPPFAFLNPSAFILHPSNCRLQPSQPAPVMVNSPCAQHAQSTFIPNAATREPQNRRNHRQNKPKIHFHRCYPTATPLLPHCYPAATCYRLTHLHTYALPYVHTPTPRTPRPICRPAPIAFILRPKYPECRCKANPRPS
jgi:hypothetical protein